MQLKSYVKKFGFKVRRHTFKGR